VVDFAGRAITLARTEPREGGLGWSPRDLDWVLLATVAGLVGIGLWAIGGITHNDVAGRPDYYVLRQGIFAFVGGLGFIGALFVNPDLYRRHKWVVYGVMTGALALVILVGAASHGSRRWIDFGFFRFQPSEFGKVLFVVFFAAFLADRSRELGRWRTMTAAVGLAAVPILLVFVQPDVGTALVYSAALAACLFIAGTRWIQLAALGAAVVLCAVAVLWFFPNQLGTPLLKQYQVSRLTGFLHPSRDPRGSTYNQNQAMISVGSGGPFGRGVSGSTQVNYDYLPEHATDFAFASYAEQRGFAGAVLLLGLYLLAVWRMLRIVTVARSAFGAILAGGVAMAFLFQVFVNVGMTIGLAPITGIPLPLVSVGGSSMIANLTAMGILQAVCVRGKARPARSAARRRRDVVSRAWS
jgi:rod shape determining protein RodA